MSDLSNKTFLVRDHGFFLPLARRLAATGAKVYYAPTWEKAYPMLNEGVIGDGFPDIEYCSDLWLVKNKVDCFVFPDIYHQGEQRELRSQGLPVWGSGDGMRLEVNREFFLKKLKDLGLDVPEYELVIGITALREYLKDKKDIFIKVSKWRGSWETRHWRDWKQDGHRLDLWAVRFGGIRETIRFLCFPKIETTLEIGGDTYNVRGLWPETMIHGLEKKDEAYIAAVTKKKDMPEQLTRIMDAFSPFLQHMQYACQWCMEVRVAGDKNFFIDATTRSGLPSTATFTKVKNVEDIIFYGAHGELVEPDYGFKYSAEAMVKLNGDQGAWETFVMPPELEDHLKVYDCCMVDGQYWFPSDDKPITEIGWLVATGDTPTEVAKEMNRLADLLPDGFDAAVESLADVIREVDDEQKKGIEFGTHPMPEPEVVLEES